jgi:hypothetical protein
LTAPKFFQLDHCKPTCGNALAKVRHWSFVCATAGTASMITTQVASILRFIE